jgi:sigma-B regulation protein RsbU (phosphoserine phosphatase)
MYEWMSLLQPTVLHLLSSLTGDSMSRPFVLTGSGRQLEVVSAIQLYSGCQKNVPIFKRFFYNRTTLYAAIRNIIMKSGIKKKGMMKSDNNKTKDELLREVKDLKSQINERAACLEQECLERCRTEEELRLAQVIIDNSPVVLFRRMAGEKPKLVYVSDNVRQMGYTAREFLDDKIHFKDIVHPDDFERIGEEIEQYAEEDVEEYTQFYRIITKNGQIRWVEDQTSVVRDDKGNKIFNQGLLVDITSRKLAEDALRKSEEKFRRIVETAGEGFILMDEDLKIMDANDAYCKLLGYSRDEVIGKTPLDLATEEFRQYMANDSEEILAKEYRELEGTVVAKDGRHVPILVHGSTLRGDQGEIIGNMAFITDMTEHKKALALAGEVQKSLLPQSKPDVQGLDIAGRNVSCDEIGGDYFDFLWRRENPDGPFTIAVGDITGHGVDSALLMTSARAFLRMRASQPGTMAEVITAMNRHLTQDVLETGRFMTLFYLTVDPQKNRMNWVRAGHDPAILYDPQQDAFEELKGSGLALGVNAAFEYAENHRRGLANGQIIAIGTDGIWEAFNKKGKMFGKQRFRDIIRQNAKRGADDILNGVYNEIRQFTEGQKSEDDITLVIVKVNKPE